MTGQSRARRGNLKNIVDKKAGAVHMKSKVNDSIQEEIDLRKLRAKLKRELEELLEQKHHKLKRIIAKMRTKVGKVKEDTRKEYRGKIFHYKEKKKKKSVADTISRLPVEIQKYCDLKILQGENIIP